MESQYPEQQQPQPQPRSYGAPIKMTIQPSDSSTRALDCNLTSLCDHIQMEGFNSGSFSDIVVHAMGSTYRLHRLILSRSSYFRNMLHGPWKEASSPIVTLLVDDKNVNAEAIGMSLAYLYGHLPKLNDNNAFRVLAAASFLDLQDLCAICTDFIISELWTSNFLAYQVFAEGQDYGMHGERVRSACWGYLCQSGAMELKEVLPKLSSQTVHALLTSDELWVPTEEKRFELALYTLLVKGALCKTEHSEQGNSVAEMGVDSHSDSFKSKTLVDNFSRKRLESELGPCVKDELEGQGAAHDILVELIDSVADLQVVVPGSKQSSLDARHSSAVEQSSSSSNSFLEMNGNRTSCSYVEMPTSIGTTGRGTSGVVAMEGPSDASSYNLNNNNWVAGDQSGHGTSMEQSCTGLMLNDWGRCGPPSISWGGRVVGRRQVKSYAKGNCGVHGEDYDTFVNIFEGGSLLYCNMSFEALLNVRKQLEELGFPCKAVNDGLWLQMLLTQRVQEVSADTCKVCCFASMACACRQPFGFSQGLCTTSYYMQEHEQNNSSNNMGNVFVAESTQGDGNGLFRSERVHVRGPIDGLAGIGRGTTFVPTAAWPPTRFVFSRVPFGMGNRNCQQPNANEDSERTDHSGDVTGDGLTALVGLSPGGSGPTNVHGEHVGSGPSMSAPCSQGVSGQMLDAPEHAIGIEWENTNSSSISLDMKTPLSHFPPFRFGIEFEDVHRLNDGQVKHSQEYFYAGSLWKVSVQAFNDEDPQGRRTLGLFLHRRKAEPADPFRKVHAYVDSREKVTARYQLICPSKREVMVFGSFKQRGTLLPKAPKGWGWRTALLFDELSELLQNGTLRVAAVVQLV
ncbi:BTB/POZ domain-containing protein [Euphorbia peplus]|nr:BTB/POZ domain-containing protein [Euphorbia peplus]